jgi:hypothetical protein
MDDLICKYVIKDGKQLGESIDVYENRLIVKVGSEFIGIPKDKIKRVEAESVHVEDFDEKDAKEFGRKWVVEKSKPVSLEELKKMEL